VMPIRGCMTRYSPRAAGQAGAVVVLKGHWETSMTMPGKPHRTMHLEFRGKFPQLVQVTTTHELVEGIRKGVRGKRSRGQRAGSHTHLFQWYNGPRAVAVLLLRYKAWGLRTDGEKGPAPALIGPQDSAADVLDRSLDDGGEWRLAFGGYVSRTVECLLDLLLVRPTRVPEHPVMIAVQDGLLSPQDIDVSWDEHLVTSVEKLEWMADDIEHRLLTSLRRRVRCETDAEAVIPPPPDTALVSRLPRTAGHQHLHAAREAFHYGGGVEAARQSGLAAAIFKEAGDVEHEAYALVLMLDSIRPTANGITILSVADRLKELCNTAKISRLVRSGFAAVLGFICFDYGLVDAAQTVLQRAREQLETALRNGIQELHCCLVEASILVTRRRLAHLHGLKDGRAGLAELAACVDELKRVREPQALANAQISVTILHMAHHRYKDGLTHARACEHDFVKASAGTRAGRHALMGCCIYRMEGLNDEAVRHLRQALRMMRDSKTVPQATAVLGDNLAQRPDLILGENDLQVRRSGHLPERGPCPFGQDDLVDLVEKLLGSM